MKFLQKITLFLPLVFAVFSNIAKAEMVDTFQFHNDADRIRAMSLAKSLRCPQCQNQNLLESNATTAYKLRIEVFEIMTQRFGNFVNYKPPVNEQTWLLWGMPVGLLGIVLVAIVWRTRTRKTGQ